MSWIFKTCRCKCRGFFKWSNKFSLVPWKCTFYRFHKYLAGCRESRDVYAYVHWFWQRENGNDMELAFQLRLKMFVVVPLVLEVMVTNMTFMFVWRRSIVVVVENSKRCWFLSSNFPLKKKMGISIKVFLRERVSST